MKNIVIAGFKHETNSFSPKPADEKAYREREYLFGDELFTHFRGVKNELGGFLDVLLEKEDIRLIPAMSFNAMPSGPVTADVYRTAERTLLDTIRAAEHVDGVLLSLHGAMITELSDDGEGMLLEAVRNLVGPDVPVIASLDFHVNMTAKMQKNADALFVYDYYPHIDMYETGVEAAETMYGAVTGRIRPVMRWQKLPLIMPAVPTHIEAVRKYVDMEHSYEEREGVLGVNLCEGFFQSDQFEKGAAVIAVTDGDAELAQSIVDSMAEQIWADREKLTWDFYTIDQAIDEALASDGRPFVFADVCDNPGAGGSCDTTHILRRLLERGVEDAAVAIMVQPDAVEAAERAGVGNSVTVRLGGNSCIDKNGEALTLTGYVKSLSDGYFRNRDEMSKGLLTRLGKTAVIVVKGIEIIVTSIRTQPFDLEVFRSQGIMPQDRKILVTKSTAHYRNSYAKVAFRMLDVETAGLAPQRISDLQYQNCRRPIYPLDADCTFSVR